MHSDIAEYDLRSIRGLAVQYFGFYSDNVYLNCDVLLHILSWLDIKDILQLFLVGRAFYGLCQTNYVWKRLLFNKRKSPSETIMRMIYANNKSYFNSSNFRNYFDIKYNLEDNLNGCGYFEMIKNIITLASDLRPPYFDSQITKIIQDSYQNKKLIYKVKAVNELPNYDEYVWQYTQSTDDSEMLLVLEETNPGHIKIKKFVKTLKVPARIISEQKIIFYPENTKKLFKLPQD